MGSRMNPSTKVSKVAKKKKVNCISSHGPPRDYYEVSNKLLIGHVLGGQNGGFTVVFVSGNS